MALLNSERPLARSDRHEPVRRLVCSSRSWSSCRRPAATSRFRRARTEVLESSSARPHVRLVVAGRHVLVAHRERDLGLRAAQPFRRRVRVPGRPRSRSRTAPTVRFEDPDGPTARCGSRRVDAARAGGEGTARSSFEVARRADELLVDERRSRDVRVGPVDVWRIPLILRARADRRVVVGERLDGRALGRGAPTDHDGRRRSHLRANHRAARHAIRSKRSASIRRTSCKSRPTRTADGLLIGLLSLDAAAQRAFDVTLHTELAEVFVRRLGAGHPIGVSMWSIVSHLPAVARVVGRMGISDRRCQLLRRSPRKIPGAKMKIKQWAFECGSRPLSSRSARSRCRRAWCTSRCSSAPAPSSAPATPSDEDPTASSSRRFTSCSSRAPTRSP